MKIHSLLTVLFFLQWKQGHSRSKTDELPRVAMLKEGDLNLGAITNYLAFSVDPICANYTPHAVLHQVIYAFLYGIEKINNDSQILPNVSLGYVILDDCGRVIPTIPRILQLLPIYKPEYQNKNVLSFGKSYDVVGIIGPYNSDQNLVVASMTGFFELPQISPYASSDALSDKRRFPYFFRTISPDRILIKATMKFAKQIGWEYVSVIHSEDEFGYNANKFVRKYAEAEKLCVEESYPLDSDGDNFDYEALLDQISGPKVKSKVFIAYISYSQVYNLLNILQQDQRYLNIVLFFSQCVELSSLRPFFSYILGSIQIAGERGDHTDFHNYYKHTVTPWSRLNDPWIKPLWEQYYACKMDPMPSEIPCANFSNIFDFPQASGQRRNIPAKNVMVMVDAVNIFALALDNMIKGECPHAFGNKSLLRMCIKGNILKDYISKVKLETESGSILKFNKNYDGIRKHVFRQIQTHAKKGFAVKVIGTYEPRLLNNNIAVFSTNIQWPSYVPLNAYGIPDSVCSYPCVDGEIYIQGDVKCCWTCHKCQENEITSNNFSACIKCPVLLWPNPTKNKCLPIQPSYLSWTHMYGITMTILTVVGIVSSITITILLIKNRDRAVIKGSSKELMVVILTGAFLAFLTIPAFLTKPTDVSCMFRRAGFNISCSLLFVPLLVKSIRVFRIFKASASLQQNIKYVSTTSQMVIVGFLVLIQVCELSKVV